MKFLAFIVLMGVAVIVPVATPRENTANVYFGTRVSDPYQWLEQKHASRTKAWVAHQVSLTERMFDHLPVRAQMQHVVLGLLNPRSDGLPQRGGSVIAFERSDGAGRRPVIVAGTPGMERVLLDPNTRWRDGSTSIADWRLAPDGRNVAYATKHAGSGFVHWHVLEVRTGNNRNDVVVGTPDWAPISWARNGSGFYYGGYPAEKMTAGAPIGTRYRVRFHRVNTKQSSDAVVYARPDHPTWLPYVQESNRSDYLVIEAIEGSGDGNFVAVRKLRSNEMPLVLRPMSGSYYRYVDNIGSRFYFTTDAAATRGRLVAIDASSPNGERDVIAQTENTLQDVSSAGGRFIARYLRDVRSEVGIFTYAGKSVGKLPLPDPATVTDVVTDTTRPVAYYRYSSPTTPPTISVYDVRSNGVRTISRVKAPFDSSAYMTEEFFARSADGTRVPVFVAHRRNQRGLLPPTLLTGYGGFGFLSASMVDARCGVALTRWNVRDRLRSRRW